MLWIIAWKNIWRNKVRSLVVIIAVTIGLSGGLFTSAFMEGMVRQRIKSSIEYEVSSIQIHDPLFSLNKEVKDTIRHAARIRHFLDTCKAVRSWSARLKVNGMIASANAGAGIIINGIHPEKEKKVTAVHTAIADSNGSYFGDEKKNAIVIGEKLAVKLKVKLRSKVILTFQSPDGSIINAGFKVTGIFKTVNTSFDEMNVFVRDSQLCELLGFSYLSSHEIAVVTKDDLLTSATRSQLAGLFPQAEILDWKKINPELGMMAEMGNQMLYILLVIILLALSFGIINTMLMAILERTREMGMLMAVGMSRTRVFVMIIMETIMLTLTGSFAGMALTAAAVAHFGVAGINLSYFSQGLEDMGYAAIVYPYMQPQLYINITLLVILTGFISSVIPARRALKLRPVEAIRVL